MRSTFPSARRLRWSGTPALRHPWQSRSGTFAVPWAAIVPVRSRYDQGQCAWPVVGSLACDYSLAPLARFRLCSAALSIWRETRTGACVESPQGCHPLVNATNLAPAPGAHRRLGGAASEATHGLLPHSKTYREPLELMCAHLRGAVRPAIDRQLGRVRQLPRAILRDLRSFQVP